MPDEMTEIFRERLTGMGIACDARTPERLARYQRMLEEWNGRMNLTGDACLETTLDRHHMDSLAPLRIEGLFPQQASLIDVGTGAGFPGLPLAIARPDLSVLLLDSLQKRLTFLEAVIAELSLENVRVAHARAEDAGQNPLYRERFDLATARAVAAAPVLMELLLPFVRIGGKAICYKGPSANDELPDAQAAARLLGAGAVRTLPVLLPSQPGWQHNVLVAEKTRITPMLYPRKAGMPSKVPLGKRG